VDLSLLDHGAAWSPANPLVQARIPKRLGDGLTLSDIGLDVTPTGAADAQAQLVDGKPFWDNVATDTDYFVRVDPAGVESFWQLRSVDSPQELRIRLQLPQGAQARVDSSPRSLGAGPRFSSCDGRRRQPAGAYADAP
jgi:hypothetical protein